VIEIVTESYEEEQFILNRFPEAWWIPQGKGENGIIFYLPVSKEYKVQEAYNEYKERKRNEKRQHERTGE